MTTVYPKNYILNDDKPSKKLKIKKEDGFIVIKLKEFCKRTDLHGYKYIVMEELNKHERIFWATAVVLSLVLAAVFVLTAYEWYARNPVVTVIESTHGAIWDIPFPAVTLCSLNIISKSAARHFVDNLTLPENVTSEQVFEMIRFSPMMHLLLNSTEEEKKELYKLQEVLDLNEISMESFFHQLSPAKSCNDIISRCMWKNTVYRCDRLFQHVYTAMGLCCTFNYFAYDQLYIEKKGILEREKKQPKRVASCGYQSALSVIVNILADDYYSAMMASQGFLVFVHNPYNIASLDSPVRLINPATEILMALSPEGTYATSGIEKFIPEQRKCYFKDEIKVGNFQQYSFQNCVYQRKVDIITNICKCVPFYHPFKESYRTCNFQDIDCLENMQNTQTIVEYSDTMKFKDMQNCLPECEHYNYPLEVAFGEILNDLKLNGMIFFNDLKIPNNSLLNVFFNDLVTTRFRRDVYLNWQNILASFGGLLSLMLGFTLISGFDCLLFFTFRMAYDIVQATKKNTLKRNPAVMQVQEKKKNWTEETHGKSFEEDSHYLKYVWPKKY